MTLTSQVIANDEWYEIRFSKPAVPHTPRGAHLEFANGDRLSGKLSECDGSRIVWKPGFSTQSVRFPASAVRRIWFADSPGWPDDQRVLPLKDRDQFLRNSGDRQSGTLTSIQPGKDLQYQAADRVGTIPIDQLQCVIFNSDLTRDRPVKGRHFRMTFNDGSRLTAVQLVLNKGQCTIKTAFQQEWNCDWNSIHSIRVVSGIALPLNQLKPSRYEYSSFSGEQYPLGINRRPDGGPMTIRTPLGAESFDSGWSIHAPAIVEFAVPKGAVRFEATVGLDAETGRRGRVTLTLTTDPPGDGKSEWAMVEGESREVTVDVTKVKTVRIRVAPTGIANVQGILNLGNARMILEK